MAKFDPKLVKKIVHSKLIACATEIGIKNADKVSKELLIPAYLDAIEKVDAEGGSDKLNPNLVNMYNEIVTTLGLDKEGDAPPEAEQPPAPVPPPPPVAPAPPVARRVGRPPMAAPTAAAPATPTDATAAPATPAAPKERKKPPTPTPKTYNRWTTLGEAVVQLKSGKVEELIALSNSIYVAAGGKDNIRESNTVAKGGITLLEKIGIITVTGDSFTSTL